MECAISIIVPIYKAEKYLRKCIDGILQQSFTDFQLILIDDGRYSIQIDPDDWVETSLLEDLYQKAIKKDADMVICDF